MSIYKNPEAKKALMELYDAKMASLNIPYQDLYVDTFAGKTHVIKCGLEKGPALVLFHGINAGAPITIEAVKGLLSHYTIYAIDTIGQATKSAETRVSLSDDSLARWGKETMNALGLASAKMIGISYGAFLLQKMIKYAPEKVEKAIFVVPSGLVNGKFWESMRRLSFPLMRFLFSKKEADLKRFAAAFADTEDKHMMELQRLTLSGTKMDYRRPPLLQASDVAHFDKPVYGIFADDDVFFPGQEALAKCQKIFKNFAGFYMLSSKHIPALRDYPIIEQQLMAMLEDKS